MSKHGGGGSSLLKYLKSGGVLFILALSLGTDYLLSVKFHSKALREFREEATQVINSKDFQTFLFICFWCWAIYFGLKLNFRTDVLERSFDKPKLGKNLYLRVVSLFLFSGTLLISFLNRKVEFCTDLLVVVFGLVVGQAVALLTLGDRSEETFRLYSQVVNSLIMLLAFSVLLQPDWWQNFRYHGVRRWEGPWWNPNHFGLLMGTGFVLALGQLFRQMTRAKKPPSPGGSFRRFLEVGVFLLAAAFMGVGLIRSYSRGAWVGVALGLGYLGYEAQQLLLFDKRSYGKMDSSLIRLILENRVPVAIIAVSTLIITFWSYRYTQSLVAQRVFSVGNVNDFSWRTRLLGYEGELQMMASKPLLGFGWDVPKKAYETLFKPSKLLEDKVIQLNDYFMVGITLGLPALVSLLGYVGVSLLSVKNSSGQYLTVRALANSWLRIMIHSALIVLLVGFWFDRGLFWLALGVLFWILLEMGFRTS